MAGGDRDALAELYDSLSRPLYSTARHILNDASEAHRMSSMMLPGALEECRPFDSSRAARMGHSRETDP